ncbi:hypothetical protein F2P44_30850 [Massilia sp. CCM 8695]|uniref:Uncharacterized protein n=1 Tax=Massilia frigida TaxID=2609281 RepID=A0ABX0NET7_9BURK|nr:hypothetical protein [Massilia frigida]NHZ83634.1 hypothetical protein [Massilia frigida]
MDERTGAGWCGYLAGQSPLQGSGRVDGFPWYFRARGSSWSLEIVDDKDVDPEQLPCVGVLPGWLVEEDYGRWPQAGYMTPMTAWPLIEKCIEKFRAGQLPYIFPE